MIGDMWMQHNVETFHENNFVRTILIVIDVECYLVITSPLVGVTVYCSQRVCVSVCLLVCFKNDASKLHKILCTCYLWLWLGRCLMTVQCVMYFRFCG